VFGSGTKAGTEHSLSYRGEAQAPAVVWHPCHLKGPNLRNLHTRDISPPHHSRIKPVCIRW
jgi:hypothetical protein